MNSDLNSEVIREHFSTHDFFYAPSYLPSSICQEAIATIAELPVINLPTDGGDVYSQVLGEMPLVLQEIGKKLCHLLAKASEQSLFSSPLMSQEIIKYRDGAALSRHRDNEGNAKSKVLLTLNGNARFGIEGQVFGIEEGDLIILRGREFSDTPTPEHETFLNYRRYVLLTEPNYD